MLLEQKTFASQERPFLIVKLYEDGLNWGISPDHPEIYSLLEFSPGNRIFGHKDEHEFSIDNSPLGKAVATIDATGDALRRSIKIDQFTLEGKQVSFIFTSSGGYESGLDVPEESAITRRIGNQTCRVDFKKGTGPVGIFVRNDDQKWAHAEKQEWKGVGITYKITDSGLAVATVNMNAVGRLSPEEVSNNLARLGLPEIVPVEEALVIAKQFVDICNPRMILPSVARRQ